MIKFNSKILFCYILFLLVHIGLVWLLPYFPSQDGPSHMYNLLILKDLVNGGKEWGSIYSYHFRATPNLAFLLISYPLLNLFPALVVEKIFISIYILLLGGSVLLFLGTFNEKSLPFIFFVFPVIFSFNLLMGFYSYVITVPFFLIAFSLCWKIRKQNMTWKFFIFNLSAFVLFYFHLIPFVLFLLSLVFITGVRTKGINKNIISQLKLLILISPSLFILFLHLIKSQGDFPADFSYLFSIPWYLYLFRDLLTFSSLTLSPWQMIPGFIFSFLFWYFLFASVFPIFQDRYGKGKKAESIPSSVKVLIYFSVTLILIYLVAPSRFGGGDFFNQRFPWLILLILLPILRYDEKLISKRFVLISGPSIAAFFLVINIFVFYQEAIKIKQFSNGLNTDLSKGAYVMIYKRWNPRPHWPRVDVLRHAASYYGIYKGLADIGNYETVFDYFPVKFKDKTLEFPPIDQIQYKVETIEWGEYPSIRYIFGWNVENEDTKKLKKYFHVILEKHPLSIWERKPVDS